MLAKTYSYGLQGLDAFGVTIEVDVSRGLPATNIVGLPDNAVKESKERIRSAIKNTGYKVVSSRTTFNLSPADTRKEGPAFDLAMALAYLQASRQIQFADLSRYIFLGELALDGRVKPVKGVLPIALASSEEFLGMIVPRENAAEAALAHRLPIYPAETLQEVLDFLDNPSSIPVFQSDLTSLLEQHDQHHGVDFNDVKGQAHVKRGLEIAAAGGHNVLMIGPPGSGKSMLAKRMPSILPDMTLEEALEVTKIYSIMGLIRSPNGIVTQRPFRSPHHTTSNVAITGGGSSPRPGEVTLSHHGILFLDELPEFNRNVLEVLRQPLEDHAVTIARASGSLRFPARFMLIAAMNPCPCGFYTDPKRACTCTPHQIQRYVARISGPLLDRIDIHLEVPALDSTAMMSLQQPESSQQIKRRAVQARQRQHDRFAAGSNKKRPLACLANAHMSHKEIKRFCVPTKDGQRLLKEAIEHLNLSARAYDKILRVARTIADMDNQDTIQSTHISEAIQYRALDRGWGQ